MIRVLNIISDTNIGCAGRVILNYLRYTDKSKFETLVAIPKGSLLKKPLEEAGKIELPRLAARIIGCSYDELMMRRERYEKRRLRIMLRIVACPCSLAYHTRDQFPLRSLMKLAAVPSPTLRLA